MGEERVEREREHVEKRVTDEQIDKTREETPEQREQRERAERAKKEEQNA